MPRRHNSNETKQKILEAAGRVFARKGFRAATIADICGLAGTNIASVNYHFGDKETLYVEAWRHAFRRSHETHPPDGGVPDTASPKERLRGWIVSCIRRVTDPASYDFEIVHMEMANPTGLLFGAMKESIEPMREQLASILRDLLGEGASEEDVQLCEMSIHSMCMNPEVHGKRGTETEREHPFPKPPGLEVDPEAIAEHVIRFSLEGLPGVRRHIQERGRARVKRRA